MFQDLYNLSIGFDEGTLNKREYLDYACLIMKEKLYQTWPGKIGRFARDMIENGYITPEGKITPEGQEWIDNEE